MNTPFNSYAKNDIRIETVILEMIEKNKYYEQTDKYKCAFRCKSNAGSRLCIAWERYPNIKAGDKVCMTGYIKNDVFIVKTLLIIKKFEQVTVKSEL